ncbi:helix-turn-helix transcriptional regulator [Sulfurimonas sp. HSL-3221]|uniref:AraC family transcriptional regulator n=1 Tax=Sulfurimonadaceae TaxID=2771471 RepID=UPI001E60241D|nr:AraC family transcriptional regulator [Sulfurimonas sp. HSL-3221]UFS63460.1 helix-turn-helix transcriptional regulator [Sulfurimonas sp. HSL-3221]
MGAPLPLYTIEETINTYKYLFKPNPTFGMDFYAEGFEAKDVVLLLDDIAPSHGIPLRFDYYALFLRLKGETIRSVNHFDYTIQPQALQLVCPGSIYAFRDISDESKTYVLLFDKAFIEEKNLSSEDLDPLFAFHRLHQNDVVLDTASYAQVLSLYEQLSYELRQKKEDFRSMAKMLITQLLFILKREKQNAGLPQNLTRAEQLSAEFLVLIEEHFWNKKSVKAYAEMMAVTPKHLSETVKATLHRSALSYIHLRIIKEIQYLLCFGNMSIKQIAYALNFESPSQLGRFFKNHEGICPKEYRLRNRIDYPSLVPGKHR